MAQAAESGAWSLRPPVRVITRPDLQGEVFTDASGEERTVELSSIDSRNQDLVNAFEREVKKAQDEGYIIQLVDPTPRKKQLAQTAIGLLPGYSAYELFQSRRDATRNDGLITGSERDRIAGNLAFTVLDVADVATGVVPLKGAAGRIVDVGGNVIESTGRVYNRHRAIVDLQERGLPETAIGRLADPNTPRETMYQIGAEHGLSVKEVNDLGTMRWHGSGAGSHPELAPVDVRPGTYSSAGILGEPHPTRAQQFQALQTPSGQRYNPVTGEISFRDPQTGQMRARKATIAEQRQLTPISSQASADALQPTAGAGLTDVATPRTASATNFLDETSPPLATVVRNVPIGVSRQPFRSPAPVEPADLVTSRELAQETLSRQVVEPTGGGRVHLETHDTSAHPSAMVGRPSEGYGGTYTGDAGPSYTTGLQGKFGGGPPTGGGVVDDISGFTQPVGASGPMPEGPVAGVAPSQGRGVAVAEAQLDDLTMLDPYLAPHTDPMTRPRELRSGERSLGRRGADPRYQALVEQENRRRAQGRVGPVSFLDETSPELMFGSRGSGSSADRLDAAAARQAMVDAQREAALNARRHGFGPRSEEATQSHPNWFAFYEAARAKDKAAREAQFGALAEVPQVRTPSGLYVPASSATAVLTQPLATPLALPATDSAPSIAPGVSADTQQQTTTGVQPEVSPSLGADTLTDTQQQIETLAQPEVAPGLLTGTQQQTGTAAQIEVASGLRTEPYTGTPELPAVDPRTGHPELPEIRTDHLTTVRPELPQVKIDPITGRPELPQTIIRINPLTGTPELPQLSPLTSTPELPWTEPRTGMPELPYASTLNLPDLRGAPAPFGATGLERAQDATPDERTHTPTDIDIPEPRPDDPFLPPPGVPRIPPPQEEVIRRPLSRRVEQPVPPDAYPVEGGRPLREDEFPRHVVHEEVVLDVDRGDGSVDRVLVDVSDPKVTAADPTPPPAGEHIAGNQRITASGKTVTGENVNPVLPPRDAAQQHPEGQVEEAVFVTDLDTSETTVHRYREEREAGESLEDQLERLSEEDRQVVASGSVPQETPQKPRSGIGRRVRMTAERLNAEARERAAGAAEGLAAGIESSDHLAEAQQRMDDARQRMDAEEHARRQALGPRGRAAEDMRAKSAGLRGTAPTTPERSAAYQKAAKDYATAEADIQRLKGESPGGVAAAIGRAGATAHRAGSRLSPQFREMINTLAQSGAQKNASKTANRRSSGVRDKDLRRPPAMTGSQSIDLGGGTVLTINRGKKKRR